MIEKSVKLTKSTEYTVKTPIGTLIVAATTPSYPGITIDLETADGERHEVVLVESNSDENGSLMTYVYGDTFSDEYTEKVVHKNVPIFCKDCGSQVDLVASDSFSVVNQDTPNMFVLCRNCLNIRISQQTVKKCNSCGQLFGKENRVKMRSPCSNCRKIVRR